MDVDTNISIEAGECDPIASKCTSSELCKLATPLEV